MKPRKLAAPNGRVPLGAASYRRVSRGGMDPENQRADIERLASSRGLELVADFVDVAGATRNRPAYDAMWAAALRREFAVLLVWSLDRLGRSMLANCNAIVHLDSLGVQVVSVREPWLDTRGPVRDLLLAVFSWVAEQERRRIIERTNAGLERARARGTRLGRPRRVITPAELERARALWKVGVPIRKLAQRIKVPRATLHRALVVSETESISGAQKPSAKRPASGTSKKRTIGGR